MKQRSIHVAYDDPNGGFLLYAMVRGEGSRGFVFSPAQRPAGILSASLSIQVLSMEAEARRRVAIP